MASGEVMASRRPMAVSVEWDRWDEEEKDGERSEDLRFFLCAG